MPRIAAVIVTHKRLSELQRLLQHLCGSTLPLCGCVISDHAPTGEVRKLAGATALETVVLEDPSNPGPGAGWAHAAREAYAYFGNLDAIWYLDDDVVPSMGCLETLWAELETARARVIAPLLCDHDGKLWGFPEPVDIKARALIRHAQTPAEARHLLGDAPLPFCWCTGACVLVATEAIEKAGLHRADFFILGEDIEYSMRLAAATKAVFTCLETVPHLPILGTDPAALLRADRVKFCSLLQNLSYLSFHVPHGGHMRNYLPGNFRRFFRSHGVSLETLGQAANCFWSGAVLAQPAGGPRGTALRRSITVAR